MKIFDENLFFLNFKAENQIFEGSMKIFDENQFFWNFKAESRNFDAGTQFLVILRRFSMKIDFSQISRSKIDFAFQEHDFWWFPMKIDFSQISRSEIKFLTIFDGF
ncbi:unnamed protein product [Caenorhabditis angaria]|uniref:Uncharacterized protein n=1 Tax=Caenorhabditis angaria TaxID=860376 RepID=A0A9P1N4A1_9PELO|nr:unnamed protein product [Caenorhabditis angaria]